MSRLSATAEADHERFSPRRFISSAGPPSSNSSPSPHQSSMTSFRTFPRLQASQADRTAVNQGQQSYASSSSSPMLDAQRTAVTPNNNKNAFVLVTPKEIGMSSQLLNEGNSIRTHQTWSWSSSSAATTTTSSMGTIQEHHHHQQSSIRTMTTTTAPEFAPLQGQDSSSSPFVPNRFRSLHISMTSSSPSPPTLSTPSIMASSPRRLFSSSRTSNMLPSPSSLDDSFDEEVAHAMLPPPPCLKPRRSMRTTKPSSFLF